MPEFRFCGVNFYWLGKGRVGHFLAFVSSALFPRIILSRRCNSSLIFDFEERYLWFLQLCFNVSMYIGSGKGGIR